MNESIWCSRGWLNIFARWLYNYHVDGSPELCWESKNFFNLFLITPVDAARSESFAEPGIISPLLVGLHLSNNSGDISFHFSVDIETKLCLVLFSLTSGTLSLILSLLGRKAIRLRMETG